MDEFVNKCLRMDGWNGLVDRVDRVYFLDKYYA